jgi:hypothetical protein
MAVKTSLQRCNFTIDTLMRTSAPQLRAVDTELLNRHAHIQHAISVWPDVIHHE